MNNSSKSDNSDYQTIETTSNKKILIVSIVISIIVIIKLALTAQEFNNWHGFFISCLHVLVVAIAANVALLKKS